MATNRGRSNRERATAPSTQLSMRITFEINLRTSLRWLLGVLFLWAAISKIANPTEFLAAIYSYQLPLPRSILQLAAMALPWLELLCGLLLLANVWLESALGCVLGLLVLFLAATGQAWLRGLDITCGCFQLGFLGLSPTASTTQFLESTAVAFVRNLCLAAASGWLFWERLPELRQSAPTAAAQPQPSL
jgi:putative oxidoreductase